MSDYVIVRINEKLIPEFQINYSATSNIASKSKLLSWADVSVKKTEKLMVMIAGSLVLTTEIKIPSKNDEVIRQSIPFALEELLANEIADNHYAYKQISEQNFLVSIIQSNIVEEINQQLLEVGLKCKALYSEIFSTPHRLELTSIALIDGYAIIRDGIVGTTVSENLIKSYVKNSDCDKQLIYSNKEVGIEPLPNATIKTIDTTLLQAVTLTATDGVNLYQGKYSPSDEGKSQANPWKNIAILGMVLAASWVVINTYQLWTVSSEIDEIKNKQARLLLELIPNASKTERRDPYSAIRSRLKSTQNQQSNNNNASFIQSLAYIGQTLASHPSIQIQSLRQRGTKLEVSLKTQDTGKLNAFQSGLKKNVLAMSVKTGTREVSNDGVSSIITMESLK